MKHLLAGLFVLFALPAVAQQTSAPKPHPPWVAAQAPEVRRLADALAGEWKTSEEFGADRNAATDSGVFSIRDGPGDNSLVLDYSSQSAMGTYSSTRIIYWDRQADRYKAFYCDSMQHRGCGEAGSGNWQGQDLVFESTTEGPRGRIQMRESFSEISSQGFTFSVDVIGKGKSERTLTIHASKHGAEP